MSKVLKWIAVVIGALVVLIIVSTAAAFLIAEDKLNTVYDIEPEDIAIPEEVNSSRREWPLLFVDFCAQCHGGFFLSGQVFEEDPLYGTIASPNLTSGEGGIGGEYSDEDWIRALRHGIDPEGKPLLIMPSQFIGQLSDEDLAEIIAYIKNLDPVDNTLPETQVGPLGRLSIVIGFIPDLLPAEVIDHEAEHPAAVPAGVSVEYGEYLSFICKVCHSEDLSGGPNAGEGMNLTPGGVLAGWDEEDFIQTLRTGVAPDGKRLNGQEMPWLTFSRFSDEEMKAIWLYLQSLPPVETEHR